MGRLPRFACVVLALGYLAACSAGRGETDDHAPPGPAAGEAGVHEHEGTGPDEHAHDRAADDASDALALDERTRHLLGIETAPAAIADFDEAIGATGSIINNENNEAHVSTLVPGRVNVLAADWGDRVKAGQVLVCLESTEIGRRRADYSRAEAELNLARQEFARKERLLQQDAVSRRQSIQAETDLKAAEINLEHARRMLLLTGLSEHEIVEAPTEHKTIVGTSVHIASPIDGVVVERSARVGEFVEPGVCLYKILDPSSVWIQVDVFEKDLPHVRRGGRMTVTVPAYPGRVFAGKIIHVGTVLDGTTRTVQVRSEVANADLALKPGMFASVKLALGTVVRALSVPEAAVLSDAAGSFVFVQEGEKFHRHGVETGARSGGRCEIASGLSEGDLVVVQGQHQLKSRYRMSAADPHAGHAH